MTKARVAACVAAVCLALGGCADNSDLEKTGGTTGQNSNNSTSSNGDGGAASSSGQTTGNGSGNTTGTPTGGSDGGASSGSSSGTTSGSTSGDGGMTTGGSSGGSTMTLGAVAAGQIACNKGAPCAAGEKCCAFLAGSSACKKSCTAGDTEAVCDGPEDCPSGKQCCSGIAKSYCADSCTGSDYVGCHTSADCVGQMCKPNSVFPIWGVCK